MSQTIIAVSQADADAAETLFLAATRANDAFVSVQTRIAEGGTLQRLGPGSWVILRPTEEAG